MDTHAADDCRSSLIGIATLSRLAFAGHDLRDLSEQLLARARSDPGDADALLDLSTILQLTGERKLGLTLQREALAIQNIFRLLPQSGVSELHALVIVAPGDLATNNVIEFLLEQANITLDLLYYTEGCRPTPEFAQLYDLAFVAVAETDQTRPLLADIAAFLALWTKPVVNLPDRIARLSRDGACALVHSAPGLVMPLTVRADWQALEQVSTGAAALADVLPQGAFPIIARPIDSQKGQGLAKIESPAALAGYLHAHDEPQFYVARYVDYRSADGLFRKYRIVLIDGRPFVCHMAISEHWMVHYMNAGMTQSAAKRAEEAQFMARFDEDFAVRHAAAFQRIANALELDYVGLDCGETKDGELLIFEFDSSMTVHAMDPVDLFPYKQPQMEKVFAAFRTLLTDRAARH